MEFEKRNREMSRNVIEGLIARGEIVSEEDGVQRLQDPSWVAEQGYGHVAHVLRSPLGIEVCRSIFALRKNSQAKSGGSAK